MQIIIIIRMKQNWNKQWLSVRWSNEVLYWSVCRVAMARKSKFDGTFELPPVGSPSRRAALLKIYRRNYKHRNKSSGQSTGQSAAPTGQSDAPTGQSAAPQPMVHDRCGTMWSWMWKRLFHLLRPVSVIGPDLDSLVSSTLWMKLMLRPVSVIGPGLSELCCKFFPLNEIHYHAAARSPSLVVVFARHWLKSCVKGSITQVGPTFLDSLNQAVLH